VIAACFAVIGRIRAQTLETVSVPVTGATVSSTTIAISGAPYVLTAYGTFLVGGPGDGLADAEFADFSNPPASLITSCGGGAPDLGIGVNGSTVPGWGVYQGSHVYNKVVVGTGAPITLQYLDCNYGDNSGSLTVTIQPSCSLGSSPFLLSLHGVPAVGNPGFGLDTSGGYAAGIFLTFLSTGFTTTPFPLSTVGLGPCFGYLELGTLQTLSLGALDANGNGNSALPIPPMQSLRGMTLGAQSVQLLPAGLIDTANAIHVVVV
jgi:hypothetical protein